MRASVPTLEALVAQGARVDRRAPTSAAPTARPTRSTASRPVAAAARRAARRARRLRDRHGRADAARQAVAALERRRGRSCSRTSASTRARPRRTRPSARAFAERARRLRRRARLRRLRRRAPQAGERLRARASCCPAPPASSSRPSSRCSTGSPRTPSGRTRSCSAARRSPTSSASSTHLLPRVDTLLIGGGMLFTFLAAQGHKVGSSLLEADQIDTVKRLPRRGRGARRRDRAARPTSSSRRRSRPTPSTWSTPADAIEDTPFGASGLGPRHRPRHRGAFAERHPRLEDGVLERPDGRVRARAVRGGHAGRRRRRSPRSTASASSAAATRPRPCASSASTTTSSVTSRRAAAQASSSSRARSSPDWRSSDGSDTRTPLIAGNWKMNLDHLQAIAFVQKLAWSAQGRQARLRRRRGRGLPAVHRPAHRADAASTPTSCRSRYGAQDLSRRTTPAPTPARSRARSSRSSTAAT